MDTNRLGSLVRALATTPSRRAVARAFSGLAAGSVLAPLIDLANVAAKKKHKKKLSKKKFCKKATGGYYCSKVSGFPPCCDKSEACVECGCCPIAAPKCCSSKSVGHYCCAENETCCPSFDGRNGQCCPPGTICCGGGCCPDALVCCPDGSCAISCS